MYTEAIVTMRTSAERSAKAHIIKHLLKQKRGAISPIIACEYTANNSEIRADLVIARARSLHGIEIKTELDSLRRLENQIGGYSRYFTHVTLAVAPKHITPALAILPKKFGLWIMNKDKVQVLRTAGRLCVTKAALVDMMNVETLSSLIRDFYGPTRNIRRSQLAAMAIQLSQPVLLNAMINSIRLRYKNVSEQFIESFSKTGDIHDLEKLSLHTKRRENLNKQLQLGNETWNAWRMSVFAKPINFKTTDQPSHHQYFEEPLLDHQNTIVDAYVD